MTDPSGNTKPSKVLPSPKTATITEDIDDADEDKKEKPQKEVPFVRDQGFFQHDTGDMYEGDFEAKKKDLSIKMHGQGVYTTAEGDIYSGRWEADKLVASDKTIITFIDGSKYEGVIKEWCYAGKGKYTYPDGSVLTGEFSDNCPVGNLVLTDPNGHVWLGRAEHGFGWFEPVNHFYEFLETTLTRVKRRHRKVTDTATRTASTSPKGSSPSRKNTTTAASSMQKTKKK